MPLSLLPSSSNKNAIEVVWAVAGEKNLIDKAYIEYGNSPDNLIYKTTPHYATLYIYHDTIVFSGPTTLFMKFVVVIKKKNISKEPMPIFVNNSVTSNYYSSRNKFSFLSQSNPSERTETIYPDVLTTHIVSKTDWGKCSDALIWTYTTSLSGLTLCYNYVPTCEPSSLYPCVQYPYNELAWRMEWMQENYKWTDTECCEPIGCTSSNSEENENIDNNITYTVPVPKNGEEIESIIISHPYLLFVDPTSTNYLLNGISAMGILSYLIPQSAIQYYTTFELNVGDFHWNVSSLFPTTGGTITLHLTGGNYKATHNYKNSVTVFDYDCDNFQRQLSTIGTETYNYIGNYGYPRINLGATSYWTDNQFYTSEMAGQPPLLTVTYKCVKPVYKLHVIFPDFLDPNSPPSITPSNLVGEYDIETGYPYAHVSVQLTEQCSSDQKDLANKVIKFSILPPTDPADMAGHKDDMHTGDRPLGEFEDGTDECTTDNTGACDVPVNYLAPEVSGRYTIKAEMEDDASVTDEQKITVSVEGLDAMPLSPDNSYRLTGQTNSHPVNHYATEFTIGKVQDIVQDYFNRRDATLGINDMSLVWGGLFDYKGTWQPPHDWHRDGTSADIDRADSDGVWPGDILKYKIIPNNWTNRYLPCHLIIEKENRLHIECSQRGLTLSPPPGGGCGGKPCS